MPQVLSLGTSTKCHWSFFLKSKHDWSNDAWGVTWCHQPNKGLPNFSILGRTSDLEILNPLQSHGSGYIDALAALRKQFGMIFPVKTAETSPASEYTSLPKSVRGSKRLRTKALHTFHRSRVQASEKCMDRANAQRLKEPALPKKQVPSGKHTKSYWKWPFIIVDIPWYTYVVIFHSSVNVYQRLKAWCRMSCRRQRAVAGAANCCAPSWTPCPSNFTGRIPFSIGFLWLKLNFGLWNIHFMWNL